MTLHRFFVIFLAAVLTALAVLASPPGVFSNELETPEYNIELDLNLLATSNAYSAVLVALEWKDDADYVRVSFTNARLALYSIQGGNETRIGLTANAIPVGQPYHLTIMRRDGSIIVTHEMTVILRGEVPRGGGSDAGIQFDPGWEVTDASVQRVTPVGFGDNFMRNADSPGQWKTVSGKWGLTSAWDKDPHGNTNRFVNEDYAQNPFAWMGVGSPALCTTGEPFWEDYTASVSVQPGEDNVVGMAVNYVDANNYLLVRWGAGNGYGFTANRLTISSIIDGKEKLLGLSPGGFVPGQWYRVSVTSSLSDVHVAVDGMERTSVSKVPLWHGGIGLYVDGSSGSVFDDVSVQGSDLEKYLLAEETAGNIADKFLNDTTNHMQEWSDPSDWIPSIAQPGNWEARRDRFGDLWMVMTVTPGAPPVQPVVSATPFRTGRGGGRFGTGNPPVTTPPLAITKTTFSGEIMMCLNGDEASATSGYRASITPTADSKGTIYTLSCNGQTLGTVTGPALVSTEEYHFRLWHMDRKLRIDRDGTTVLEADAPAVTGLRAFYRTTQDFSGANHIMVLGSDMLDYTFADAPVDWIEDGTWMPTTRWACDPKWSFLAGWSRDLPALWHKDSFTGDQAFQAYIGVKMEYPREQQTYDDRYRDMAISICADGHNPRSGYSLVYGAADDQGNVNQRTVLMRNGVIVDSVPMQMPQRGIAHRDWFNLELHKRGDTIEAWLENQLIITYKDPQPITGGVPVIWTSNSAVSVARARVWYANPPQPRTDPPVVLASPYYAEWMNQTAPLSLDFSDSWAGSGKPVDFTVTKRVAPSSEKDTPTVQDGRLTFAPSSLGDHWYTIRGSDGASTSLPYQLSLMVFNPALGRDDSHTLLLYRFDEGSGNVIHDQAAEGDKADCIIPDKAPVVWQAGHGLSVKDSTIIASANNVSKLSAIADKRACTIEFWVSSDTQYPVTSNWISCLFSWGANGPVPGYTGGGGFGGGGGGFGRGVPLLPQNFAVGQEQSWLILAPRNGDINYRDNNSMYNQYAFHLGLRHFVYTWDGTTTNLYVNGQLYATSNIVWNEKLWTPQKVFLANTDFGDRGYIGTYYMVAIQDKCLTGAEVRRNFQAGPDAR